VYAELMGNALGVFDRDYRRGGFYNQREAKWMLLLNLNVRDLICGTSRTASRSSPPTTTARAASSSSPPSRGRIPPASTLRRARLRQPDIPLPGGIGVSADPTGVTVASDQAMYVLGDYNRGTGQRRHAAQPASIIGDSVNLLSQRYWLNQAACNNTLCRDGQSTQGLASARATRRTPGSMPPSSVASTRRRRDFPAPARTTAASRTIPASTRTGPDEPELPGIVRSLGEPEHVNGDWCGTGTGCNIYNPPNRLWNFDAAFNNAANLPPLTPPLRLRPAGPVHRRLQIAPRSSLNAKTRRREDRTRISSPACRMAPFRLGFSKNRI
jgi:hypothetical protein